MKTIDDKNNNDKTESATFNYIIIQAICAG